MPKARVVVVEDEPAIRRGIADALRLTGYDVTEAADGPAGLKEGVAGGIDLVLLDLMLPKRDGMEVLAELRRVCPTRPVIILTARGSEDDRVRGLKMGADDYVVKPFSARELIARVEAVLRRTLKKTVEVTVCRFGRGTIDLQRREVRWADADPAKGSPGDPANPSAREKGSPVERTDLSETEAALLKYLVSNRDRAVSREELLGRVWGIGTAGLETRAVDMHIARLRAKLKDPSGEDHPEAIVTVRAHGYMAGPGLTVTEDEA